jgi:DNA polymerase III subunit gamma/tau
MSTTVLARKWRPQSLDQVIGQDHVTKALTHALDSQRIHHAYLFTGTRGVGKTSLSRILAKSFNCEEKIAAKACGICSQCLAMQASKNIDYIEVDAASNRGVDEISTILESAIYQPSAARFKIFMIDEVHMLSQHAFNAMLKILEEPPEYTKFILATTETHKVSP